MHKEMPLLEPYSGIRDGKAMIINEKCIDLRRMSENMPLHKAKKDYKSNRHLGDLSNSRIDSLPAPTLRCNGVMLFRRSMYRALRKCWF